MPTAHFPRYATPGAAGFDFAAYITTPYGVVIPRGKTRVFGTGIFLIVPDNYEVQVRSRSGLAFKNSVYVLNSPGTIDCDYRGELKIALHNAGWQDHIVHNGDRIAQGVLQPAPQCDIVAITSMTFEQMAETERGANGMGSTGR